MRPQFATVLTLIVLVLPGCGRGGDSRTQAAPAAKPAPADASASKPRTGASFDYYLLSLSWSPEYCSGPNASRDGQQCGEGRRFGFVVHGLWPQAAGGNPQNCGAGARVPRAVVDAMLPLMPSPGLIQHEWTAHGTCSGLDVKDYFDEVRRAYEAVKIPDDFRQPQAQIMVKPADVRAKFARANPSFPADAFRLRCGGRYLSEVRVCMTNGLKGRSCDTDVRDNCRADSVIMRPVR